MGPGKLHFQVHWTLVFGVRMGRGWCIFHLCLDIGNWMLNWKIYTRYTCIRFQCQAQLVLARPTANSKPLKSLDLCLIDPLSVHCHRMYRAESLCSVCRFICFSISFSPLIYFCQWLKVFRHNKRQNKRGQCQGLQICLPHPHTYTQAGIMSVCVRVGAANSINLSLKWHDYYHLT